MKLAIFGATGATGHHLVQQALQAGHHVAALIRTPGTLPFEHERLRAVVGTFDHPLALRQTVRGADAVISVVGVRKGAPATACADGMAAILTAMRAEDVRRLIALSAYGAGDSATASWLVRFVRLVIAAKMRDKDQMEALVRASDTAWTLVRPPALTNGAATGRYRAGVAFKPGVTGRLSRANLAAFMLREALGADHVRSAVVVAE